MLPQYYPDPEPQQEEEQEEPQIQQQTQILPTTPPPNVPPEMVENVVPVTDVSVIPENKKDCPICSLEITDDAIETSKCHNFYHGNCLKTWCNTKTNCKCPICRRSLVFPTTNNTVVGGKLRKRKTSKKLRKERKGRKTVKKARKGGKSRKMRKGRKSRKA